MKRRILEAPAAPRSSRPDARVDPMATTKISRAELDAVLNRTRSGTRPAVRPETAVPAARRVEVDDDLPGPREDDGPEITIRKIESIEIDLAGNPMLPRDSAPAATPPRISAASPVTTFTPAPPPNTGGALHLRPSIAPVGSRRSRGWQVSIVVLIFLVSVGALVAAFFAGRVSLHW